MGAAVVSVAGRTVGRKRLSGSDARVIGKYFDEAHGFVRSIGAIGRIAIAVRPDCPVDFTSSIANIPALDGDRPQL